MMAKPGKDPIAGDDGAAREEAAREAAEVAVELTEASDLTAGAEAEGEVTPEAEGASRRGLRRVAGAIGAARAGVARQSSTIARRTTDVAGAAGRGTRAATGGLSSAITWLTGQVVAMGPRLSIRDQATLRREFPGRGDEEIAELLIERAGRASGAVGGATGAWAALPVLPAFPAEIVAETLIVVGIEIKMVAELHEVLGLPAQGSGTDRARAYLAAWSHRRGLFAVPGGFVLVAGSPLARILRKRLAGRVRRSAFALGPVFTGAVAGVLINRRETRKLGREILDDLRRHRRETGLGRDN
jgi:hypothetical protein